MKLSRIIVAAWLITSNSVSIEGRLLRRRRPKGKGKGRGKTIGKGGGKENMPWTKQSIVEQDGSSSEDAVMMMTTSATTTAATTTSVDLFLVSANVLNVKDNPVGIFSTLIDGGVSNLGIMSEMLEMPVSNENVVVIPSESETTVDADGNVRTEDSFEVVGESNDSQVPGFGSAQFAKGLSKTSGYTITNKKGKLIERAGSTLTSGDIILVDETKVKGKIFNSGKTTTDPHTGIITLEGEISFNGSIEAPNGKEFTGELKTGGYLTLDCSNERCKDGLFNGKDLGGGSFTSLDGVSVQENGAIFNGIAKSEGNRTIDDEGIITAGGNAFFSGVLDNSDGGKTVGKWFTGGSVIADKDSNPQSGGGSVIFDGTFKDDALGFEFSGNASADGSYGIQDGLFVLEGTVQANGESLSGPVVSVPVELFVQFATALTP